MRRRFFLTLVCLLMLAQMTFAVSNESGVSHGAGAAHVATSSHTESDQGAALHASGGHAAIHSKPVSLISPDHLAELDQARHKDIEAHEVILSTDPTVQNMLRIFLLGLMALLVIGGIIWKSGLLGNLSIGGKLYAGFGAVVALAVLTGTVGYYSLDQVNRAGHFSEKGMELDMLISELNTLQYEFIVIGIEDREKGEEILVSHTKTLAAVHETIEELDASDHTELESGAIDQIRSLITTYETTFTELADNFHIVEDLKELLDEEGAEVGEKLAHLMHEHEADLDEMQAAGISGQKLAGQISMVELLAECEILELKLAHTEIEFLLDKHSDRIAVMGELMGELLATLGVVEAAIPDVAMDKAEEQADLAELAKINHTLGEYQKQLSQVIESELLIDVDLIECSNELLEAMEHGIALAHLAEMNGDYIKHQANIISILLMVIGVVLGGLLAISITLGITKPIVKVIEFAIQIGSGDTSRRLEINSKDETGKLADAMNGMANAMAAKAHLADRIAGGDLTAEVTLLSDKDTLGKALKTMVNKLQNMISNIQTSTMEMESGSTEIATASQNLSSGATESAASLEEISSSLTEINHAVSKNADRASQSKDAGTELQEHARLAEKSISTMNVSMQRISDGSQEIEKVIKVIDDIAFQTNLLALNAAVEAARAGKHGQGFAVVAEEVRNLAGRSAKAASETSSMIGESIQRASEGAENLVEVNASFTKISEGLGNIVDLVDEIASATTAQATGIAEVTEGTSQLDTTTQLNSATSEETAAAAQELSAIAGTLTEMTKQFVIHQGNEDEQSSIVFEDESAEQDDWSDSQYGSQLAEVHENLSV